MPNVTSNDCKKIWETIEKKYPKNWAFVENTYPEAMKSILMYVKRTTQDEYINLGEWLICLDYISILLSKETKDCNISYKNFYYKNVEKTEIPSDITFEKAWLFAGSPSFATPFISFLAQKKWLVYCYNDGGLAQGTLTFLQEMHQTTLLLTLFNGVMYNANLSNIRENKGGFVEIEFMCQDEKNAYKSIKICFNQRIPNPNQNLFVGGFMVTDITIHTGKVVVFQSNSKDIEPKLLTWGSNDAPEEIQNFLYHKKGSRVDIPSEISSVGTLCEIQNPIREEVFNQLCDDYLIFFKSTYDNSIKSRKFSIQKTISTVFDINLEINIGNIHRLYKAIDYPLLNHKIMFNLAYGDDRIHLDLGISPKTLTCENGQKISTYFRGIMTGSKFLSEGMGSREVIVLKESSFQKAIMESSILAFFEVKQAIDLD